MLVPNPKMVHKSLKCIHLACLGGYSFALRAECDWYHGAHHHHLILYVIEKISGLGWYFLVELGI